MLFRSPKEVKSLSLDHTVNLSRTVGTEPRYVDYTNATSNRNPDSGLSKELIFLLQEKSRGTYRIQGSFAPVIQDLNSSCSSFQFHPHGLKMAAAPPGTGSEFQTGRRQRD